LWQTRLSGDISGAPVTFEVDGKQYLAIAAGGRVAPTGTLGRLVGVDVAQGTGVMWVFALPDDAPRAVPRPRRALPTVSVLDGVFRTSQAAQGEQLFAQECSTCHEAVNYTGQNFAAKWSAATLGDVYQDISLSMPPANPGGLTPVSYASILAYFLRESAYPAGNADLPGNALQLRSIAIEPAPAPDVAGGGASTP
jgi:hypothetical protein